ncbi:MAG: acetoacetate--CoA ligase [Firmicutes bacterium]|nr:acetoacetate--CoA ligase [Alicyclobacillaceae bacterium]MCL6496954.1 acetoacetate--CoA ligase [Bacillota bacterium]
MNGAREGALLWTPSPERAAASRLWAYAKWLGRTGTGPDPDTYASLWQWSVSDLEGFWRSVWRYFRVGPEPPGPAIQWPPTGRMPGVRWFPEASVNYAAYLVEAVAQAPVALWWGDEVTPPMPVSGPALVSAVARARQGLKALGVAAGDGVAGILPNRWETVVAFLATASLGAVWVSCAPEFGPTALVERLVQIQPKVVLAADGYRYGGVAYDRRTVLGAVRDQLSPDTRWVWLPVLGTVPEWGAGTWEDLVAHPGPFEWTKVPFDHPLWVLFSSGTTGPPKAIVHGHGGMLLEHLKALGLHLDLGPGDRVFWYTTTGWMMWNFLVGAMLVGSEPVFYDGHPFFPHSGRLWELAAAGQWTCFGTSAAYLAACRQAGLEPGKTFPLSSLKTVGSTGSPLGPQDFGWVYQAVSDAVWLTSISGGTDVCSVLVGGIPWFPVRAGELSGPWLGVAAAAFDEMGRAVVDTVGELVVTQPLPSMPVAFLNDPHGARLLATYFGRYPGVWCHGDWVRFTPEGSLVIYGRSDATLNRRGVRIGTAEIYQVVEALPMVQESLAVEVSRRAVQGVALFVVLAPGHRWEADTAAAIRRRLAEQLSPRHVPDWVVGAPAIPKTLTGKKLEVPVRRILAGEPVDQVVNLGAVANPEALAFFVDWAKATLGPA